MIQLKKTGLWLLLCCLNTALSAQTLRIEGRVVDAATNQPLAGAVVLLEGFVTQTEFSGQFSIEIKKQDSLRTKVVLFGYKPLDTVLVSPTEGGYVLALREDNFLLNSTTVTAGKFEKSLSELTVSLDVLKPALIEAVNTRRIDDFLQKVPGVTLIDGQANIRGGSGWSYGAGSRVLLLIDDVPALQADAGFANWKDVPVENIEQVEVVKGAASALYGSSAMNGIINIRTGFAKATPETKFSTFYTQYLAPRDTVKHWYKSGPQPYEGGFSAAHKQRFGRLDVAAALFYYNQSSFNKDSYDKNGRFSANLSYKLSEKWRLGLNTLLNTGASNNFFYFSNHLSGAYIGARGTYASSEKTRFILDPYAIYNDSKGNKHKILGRIYSIDNNLSNNQSNQSILYYGEYQYQKRLKERLVLTTGLVGGGTQTRAELYGNETYMSNNAAAYIQADYKWGQRWNFSAGYRYEFNRIIGPDSVTFTPRLREAVPNQGRLQDAKPVARLGVNYQAAPATFVRASWGQGYRFQTVAEMFINTTAGGLRIFPNPQLTSETGWTGELGLKQGIKTPFFVGFLDVAAFWSEYQNMMEFLFAEALFPKTFEFGFQSQNVGATVIKGIETSVTGQAQLGQVQANILMGYTYIDPKFKSFDLRDTSKMTANYNVLKYRFRHSFKADVGLKYGAWGLGAAVIYNSRMENIDRVLEILPGIRDYRLSHDKGFATLDIRANYQTKFGLTATLIVANATNTEYSYRPGILEAPRNVQVRLDYKF